MKQILLIHVYFFCDISEYCLASKYVERWNMDLVIALSSSGIEASIHCVFGIVIKSGSQKEYIRYMPSVFSCHGSFSKLPPKESEKKRIGMTLWHILLSMIGASLENASKITSAHHIDRNFAKQVNSRC